MRIKELTKVKVIMSNFSCKTISLKKIMISFLQCRGLTSYNKGKGKKKKHRQLRNGYVQGVERYG